MMFGRSSKPRSHALYNARYARTEKFMALDGSMIVELRANKTTGAGDEGLQTVFPGSVHPSGELVEWDTDYDQPTPREMKPDELRKCVARLATAALLVAIGWEHQRAVAFAQSPEPSLEALAGVGEKGVQRIGRWLGIAAPLPPRQERPPLRSVPSREQVLKRATAYMERVPGAVSGAGGHQQTWAAALSAVRGFDLDYGEAMSLLGEYNRRCDPPWSDAELQHKVTDALKAERVGRGWLLEDRQGYQKGGGRNEGSAPMTSAHPDQGQQQADTSGGIESPSAPPEDLFPTQRICAVADEGPPRWLVRDLWLDQAVGIIGGEPKSYKSFAAAQLATCIASGKPMFGKYEVQQGRVLMFNAEDRPAMTRHRIAQMCRSQDVDLASLDLHLIDVPALRLDDDEQVNRLARTVRSMRPTLLILDPMRDLHGLDENDAQIVSALLSPLRVMQRNFGCSVMLVHHMAKATELGRRAGQRLRGTSALHGWIDSALYLTHKDGAIKVEVEHRAAQAPDPILFKLEKAETPDGPALWLEQQGDEDEGAEIRDTKSEVAENKVIQVVAGATEPLTMRDLRTMVKQRSVKTDEAVRRLVARGLLIEEPVTKGNNQTMPGYSLNKERL
jgi:hypothetical protein